MTNIEDLLKLVARFDEIKYLDYENIEHRRFNNSILIALKWAAPEIANLQRQFLYLRSLQDETTTLTAAESQAAEAPAPMPSSAAPSSPETAHNTRTPAETTNTDGTAASADHKSGSAGTPAASGATLDAVRKAAAGRKTPSSKSSRRKPTESSADALRQPPPATR